MRLNLKQLYGRKLGADDGEFGHVKDVYFDDQSWKIRYLVADTGSWLSGRQVLLSPHAFEITALTANPPSHRALPVNLTRKQIEDSPSIESHRPISRQFEEEYYAYYGWPIYWQAAAILTGAGVPPLATSPTEATHHGHNQRDDLHLRSTKATTGFHVKGKDATVGTVDDFIVDPKKWTIPEIAVEAGHWYDGKTILLSTAKVSEISYEDSTVTTGLTMKELARPRA
ncbi:MAG TPA: PRC-barrel domain-containing protein [Lacunisphaera sp.]|jgi:uncharacterized protein YrrD